MVDPFGPGQNPETDVPIAGNDQGSRAYQGVVTEIDEVSVAGYGSWVFESAFAFVFPLGFQN